MTISTLQNIQKSLTRCVKSLTLAQIPSHTHIHRYVGKIGEFFLSILIFLSFSLHTNSVQFGYGF